MAILKEFSEVCFDLTIRIEDIIWIGGMTECPSEAFKERVWDDPEELLALLGMEDVFAQAVEEAMSADDDMDAQQVLDEVVNRGKLGFLVKASTPVVALHDEPSGSTAVVYSWGRTHNRWFYAEAFDAGLMEQVKAWRDSKWPKPVETTPEALVSVPGGPVA